MTLLPAPVDVATPAAMAELGARLAEQLGAGQVVAIRGPLGAGKTTLVRGLCAALGVASEDVSSPTYALCNVYAAPGLTVAHMDLYRLEDAAALLATGLEEWIAAPGVLCLIEWPDHGRAVLPADTLWLELTLPTPQSRRVRQIAAP